MLSDLTRYFRVLDQGAPRWARQEADRFLLLDRAPYLGGKPTGEVLDESAPLLAPAEPSKIVAVGRNYRAHAKELGNEVPAEPLLFLKPPTAIVGPGAPVLLPPQSQRVEHEAELAVVIGQTLRRASPEDALAGVFGYTCANDVTARDLQRKDVQFTRGKGFDTFCPLGPALVAGVDPSALSIRCWVGDELRQDGNTREMVFPVAALLSYMSHVMTLLPGDVVLTGTPAGVGPLPAGQVCTIEIEHVGRLQSPLALS